MDRIVRVKVCGHYLVKDNRKAGVQHESNAVVMRIEFDPGWDSMAKKITFWNADGKNPVERLLTADLLEDMSVDTRTYLCPIPGEAMDEAGEMTFIIDGYVDGKRQRSISDTLKVEAAPFIERADEPSDPTPSQAEQLQVQIDTLLGDMEERAVRAETAAAAAGGSAQTAAAAADNAANSEHAAEGYAAAAQRSAGEAESAKSGAQSAQRAAEKARDEARQIAGGEFATAEDIQHHNIDPAAHEGEFLRTSGGSLTGDVAMLSQVADGSGGVLGAYEHYVSMSAWNSLNNGANRRNLLLYDSDGKTEANEALVLLDRVNGENRRHTVLHSGNCSAHALPIDGSKAMTGHLNVRSGNAPNPIKLYTEENGAGFVGTHEDNGVYKFVRFLPSNVSNIETAHFVSNVSGEYKEYPLLHSGNFSSYAVSKTGDAMTGALRVASAGGNVVMDSNANHAYLQSYKDGDWGGRRSLVLRNRADDPDMTNALSLGTLDDGTWKEHPFLHTGNLHLLNSLNLGGAQFKTDTYLGNGNYGPSNPNVIEIGFEPKMVIVQVTGMDGYHDWAIWIKGCITMLSYDKMFSNVVQSSGSTFKWYCAGSAQGQLNTSGMAYSYLAIG